MIPNQRNLKNAKFKKTVRAQCQPKFRTYICRKTGGNLAETWQKLGVNLAETSCQPPTRTDMLVCLCLPERYSFLSSAILVAILHLGRFHFTSGNVLPKQPNNQTTKHTSILSLQMDQHLAKCLTTSCAHFFPPAFCFPNETYLSFQFPQVESNRSIGVPNFLMLC